MLCNRCGSLEHWGKNCQLSGGTMEQRIADQMAEQGCPECVRKDAEISRLKAKYEMSAEDKLARIREQNRAAQERYRNKPKAS